MAEFLPMTTAATSIKYMLGAVLLGATGSSLAVSLGAMRGAAVVGRSFDMSLTAQLADAEGLSSVCVSADIFFGDNQLPPGRVSIATVAGVKAHEALIRIRADPAVNEPVVTVLLREGCLQSRTRKYVILADIQTDDAVAASTVDGEVVPSTPVAAQPVTARVLGGKDVWQPGIPKAEPSAIIFLRDRPSRLRTQAGPSAKAVHAQLAAAAEPRPARSSSRLAASAAPELARKSARSRLKLDPLDLTSVRDPVLRSSTELLTMPSTVAQQRVAAAALWQALNAQPQEVLRNNLRLKSLETDVEKILAQSDKTERSVAELRVQLEQARGEKYSNWLVFALGALLMLGMLTAGILRTRGRRQNTEFADGPWWHKEGYPENKPDLPVSAQPDPESMVTPAATHLGGEGKGTESSLKIDLDLTEPHVTNLKNVRTPASAATVNPLEPREYSGFSLSFPSLVGMPRIMNTEELSGVQHQVDFFMSLGHFDKAVDVLRHHISDNVETSTLAYLDLFALYHRLDRRDDYELLRTDFNLAFNAEVPVFDEYSNDSHGLEFYASALSRIESLWQTPRVLNVIEETIFRKPDSKGKAFSLVAYRELLMLHAIARETSEPPAGQADFEMSGPLALPVSGFSATHTQPLSAELREMSVRQPLAAINLDLTQPPDSCGLGLDIDLSRDGVRN